MSQYAVFLVRSGNPAWLGLRALLEELQEVRVVGEACTLPQAKRCIPTSLPDIIITTGVLEGTTTAALLKSLRECCLASRVIVILDQLEPAMLATFADLPIAAMLLWSDVAPRRFSRALAAVAAGYVVGSPRVARALCESGAAPRDAECPSLSPREQQVLDLLVEGATDQEIARLLVMSYHTVPTYVHNMREKLGARTRSQLCYLAGQWKLVAPETGTASREPPG